MAKFRLKRKAKSNVDPRTEELLSGRMLSLCTGIGGIELGLKLACPSIATVCYVEREAFCCAHLVAAMQEGFLDEAPIWTDVKSFDGKPWRGQVDIITGGYPCQPFSNAGKRLGEADPRHIWPDICRIVREVSPQIVFFENVAAHVTLGFSTVARDLGKLGYRVESGLYTAAETGNTHFRRRLFIFGMGNPLCTRFTERIRRSNVKNVRTSSVGVKASNSDVEQVLLFPPGPDEKEEWQDIIEAYPDLAPAVADPISIANGSKPRTSRTNKPRKAITRWKEKRNFRRKRTVSKSCSSDDEPKECEIERPFRSVVDGFSNRVHQLRALGNACVPDVVALAWRTLLARHIENDREEEAKK